ncbi:hypothetical protein [Hyphomonas sp.]|uniref:DUF7483 domain-containing protein n=1 Tax=Hyphomonas sp. TaxID=87 RepID=UPI0025B83A7D|nr:hypothetical protein [Hyphomonas sp.]|tara:strand:- start:9 stop:1055 length:1047 start_codon:yes stop_codon:yes gene_type:complete
MAYITFQPSDHFNTKLYTGNGSTQSITGVGFQPDMTWGKARSTTTNHVIQTSVQGLSTAIFPNLNNSESTGLTNAITSFDSDGFSLGDWSPLNASSQTFVSWNWKAGGGQGSSNTDGTINTTYTSVNTTAGISISKVTLSGSGNQTIGHGLGVTPEFVIFKCTSHAEAWFVYHHKSSATPQNNYYQLNSYNSVASATAIWGAGMTSSTVGVKVGTTGTSGQDYMVYAFAPKKGFSKFGSYTGNGNANGAFIYTGFKPGFILTKLSSTGSEDWKLHDTKRPGFNLTNDFLQPSNNGAELDTSNQMDILSNGFKWRSANTATNSSGNTIVYMAFAAEPLVSSNNIPATAR